MGDSEWAYVVTKLNPGYQDQNQSASKGQQRRVRDATNGPVSQQRSDDRERKKEDPYHREIWAEDLEQPDQGIKPEHVVTEKRINKRSLAFQQPLRIHRGGSAFPAQV